MVMPGKTFAGIGRRCGTFVVLVRDNQHPIFSAVNVETSQRVAPRRETVTGEVSTNASASVGSRCSALPTDTVPELVPTSAIFAFGKRCLSVATMACVSMNESFVSRKKSSTPPDLSDGVSTSTTASPQLIQ